MGIFKHKERKPKNVESKKAAVVDVRAKKMAEQRAKEVAFVTDAVKYSKFVDACKRQRKDPVATFRSFYARLGNRLTFGSTAVHAEIATMKAGKKFNEPQFWAGMFTVILEGSEKARNALSEQERNSPHKRAQADAKSEKNAERRLFNKFVRGQSSKKK